MIYLIKEKKMKPLKADIKYREMLLKQLNKFSVESLAKKHNRAPTTIKSIEQRNQKQHRTLSAEALEEIRHAKKMRQAANDELTHYTWCKIRERHNLTKTQLKKELEK